MPFPRTENIKTHKVGMRLHDFVTFLVRLEVCLLQAKACAQAQI